MSFKESVIITAIIVVFCLMILISTVLNKTSYTIHADSCPDYWTTLNKKKDAECLHTEFGCCSDYATPKTDASGANCPIKCYNTHQLGSTSSTCTSIPMEVDFGTEEYKGNQGLCKKQTWAKQCDLTWDGVTNVASAC
jgi:hypothetical protein